MMISTKHSVRAWKWAIMVAGVVLMTTACMGSYGIVRQDADLPARFLTGQVPADYNYYFNGRENAPYAIIGIRPEYKFVAKFWTPIEPNTEAFKKMARGAWTTSQYDKPVAGVMVTPEGKEVGLWYSYYPWATIEMKGANQVAVYSPYKPGGNFETSD
jgi:hypothetical protein